MPGAFCRVGQCTVAFHQLCCVNQIIGRLIALFHHALPEFAFLGGTATKRENDGQGNLAFTEVIADGLAEFSLLAGIIQRIIDELKRDAQIAAIGFKRLLFIAGAAGDGACDFDGEKCARVDCRGCRYGDGDAAGEACL